MMILFVNFLLPVIKYIFCLKLLIVKKKKKKSYLLAHFNMQHNWVLLDLLLHELWVPISFFQLSFNASQALPVSMQSQTFDHISVKILFMKKSIFSPKIRAECLYTHAVETAKCIEFSRLDFYQMHLISLRILSKLSVFCLKGIFI